MVNTIVGSDQFSRPKLRNFQAFIGFSLLYIGQESRCAGL
jgi:hypothetical protein